MPAGKSGPPGTRLRNFRAEDDLWLAAKAIAQRRSEDLSSAVLRPALEAYVILHDGPPPKPKRRTRKA